MAPAAGTDTDAPAPSGTAAPRKESRASLYAVIAMTLAGMGTIVYGVVFANRTDEPLDTASTAIVAAACKDAYIELKTLTPLKPDVSTTFADRASLTNQENAIFTAMADKIAFAKPTDNDGKIALSKWIEDWRAVIDRRARYATDLGSVGDDAQLVLPKDGGAPVTNRMNKFSRTHDLIGCATHNLQAEIVDGVRVYPTDPTKVP